MECGQGPCLHAAPAARPSAGIPALSLRPARPPHRSTLAQAQAAAEAQRAASLQQMGPQMGGHPGGYPAGPGAQLHPYLQELSLLSAARPAERVSGAWGWRVAAWAWRRRAAALPPACPPTRRRRR